MPFRFRRFITAAPGVRPLISRSGAGASVGGRGAHYPVHLSARRTALVEIPDTGLGHTE